MACTLNDVDTVVQFHQLERYKEKAGSSVENNDIPNAGTLV